MTLIPYDINKSKQIYDQHYGQVGRGVMPVFTGAPYQKGYGLGSLLSGFFKSALPILKQGAASLGKTALKTGLQIAQDGIAGENISESAKRRFKAAGSEVISNALNRGQGLVNSNKRNTKAKKRKANNISHTQTSAGVKRRVRRRDIFS